jgi:AraC-like DNA-binding protein
MVQTVLLLLLLGLFYGCSSRGKERPRAVRGVLDLSTWDFARDGFVTLEGEWEFYWKKFLYPRDFFPTRPEGRIEYAVLPSPWNPGLKMYLPDSYRGYATYRLKVNLDPALSTRPGLRVHIIHSAGEIFANGVLVHENGHVAKDTASIVVGFTEAVVPLPVTRNGTCDIVIHAANYYFPTAGLEHKIVIGELHSLRGAMLRDNLLAVFLTVVFLLFGIYELAIFYFQRAEPQNLYFGLFCLCSIVHLIGVNNSYWSSIFPSFPWDRTDNFMSGAMYMAGPFFFSYLQRLFPLDVPKRFVIVISIICIPLATAMFFLPADYTGHALVPYHLYILVLLVTVVYFILRVSILRRGNAFFVLTGLVAMTIGGVLDMMAVFELIDLTIDNAPLGFMVMCLIQITGLSREFIRTKQRSAGLASDNERLKARLDERMRVSSGLLTGNIESKIDAAIEYLKENFSEDISRENLAAALDIHPDNFSRYFKLHTGKNYGEYLNDLRIDESIRLLLETELGVVAIAVKVGFRSPRTFNHAFIQSTGRTPRDVRKAR